MAVAVFTSRMRPLLLVASLVFLCLPLLASEATAATPIDVCGFFTGLSPETADHPTRVGIDANSYNLIGSGVITPEDISTRVGLLTHPLVRLTGLADGENVTNYRLTQVQSCTGLPNTSTDSTSEGTDSGREVTSDLSGILPIAVMGVGIVLLAAAGLLRPHRRR